jgi:hypothetical protein
VLIGALGPTQQVYEAAALCESGTLSKAVRSRERGWNVHYHCGMLNPLKPANQPAISQDVSSDDCCTGTLLGAS